MLITLYGVALLFPLTFDVGSTKFTGTRLFFSLICLPVLLGTLSKIRIQICDILILCYAAWAAVCFVKNHGLMASIEPSGSHFVEVVGSYYLARLTLRTPANYIYWVHCLFVSILILLPIAFVESISGYSIVLDFLRKFVPVFPNSDMPFRLGLRRAQTVFEHPILYGVFCASSLSGVIIVLGRGKSTFTKLIMGALVSAATFFSISSGAYLSIAWQLFIMAWNAIFSRRTHRWWLLVLLVASAYVVVDFLSNRTPFEVFISYLTFDLNSSYTRVLTWRYGTSEVLRHPLFGLGLNEWERPSWLTPSVDNFWLLRAMRFGFPGIILLLATTLLCARGITHRMDTTQKDWAAVSTAQLCVLIGTCASLMTVDAWSGSQTLFFFSLGGIVSLNQSFKNNFETRFRR